MSEDQAQPQSPWSRLVQRLAPGMKFPQLFTIVLGLFLLDLFLPDPIWFVDEILLALLTVLVGMIRTREPAPRDVDQPSDEPAQRYDP
jgi:hypothetical protein